MTYHTGNLWPSMENMDPSRDCVPLTALKERGPYASWDDLIKVHVDLSTEDFLCAASDQVNAIRADPTLLDRDLDCYEVVGTAVRSRTNANGNSFTIGTEFTFTRPAKYKDVEWDEEKRLMRTNLVFLSQDKMQSFHVGQITQSGQKQLKEGKLVVQMAAGMDSRGYPIALEPEPFVGKRFHLVDCSVFHFPYMMVTKALRDKMDSDDIATALLNAFYDPAGVEAIQAIFAETTPKRPFLQELVQGVMPSRRPEYLDQARSILARLCRELKRDLNSSQALALEKVLQYRVALIQGPPGTGKTFVGAKIAQLFVNLKNACPSLLPGPILVVTQSNHAVQEFLKRCGSFSEKVIECRSGLYNTGEAVKSDLQKEHDKAKPLQKSGVLRRADIIGMTTTRGACIASELNGLGIRVVIVEEAAEVLEAHVLACIPRDAQHLIQIGDHRQLKPIPAHRELGQLYRLDLSLFERLVNNGADCPMLSEQRRMRPSIADLVRPTYPNLTDHASTRDRPALRGVLGEPVFFVNHAFPEQEEGKGWLNPMEAELAVELAAFLVGRSYPVASITILTTYRRQLRMLSQLVSEHANKAIKDIRISTVDGFQGEENEIIILSLVRSNASGKVGFLKMANRACVALTRARNGFFLLGNAQCLLASQVPVWQHVAQQLSAKGRLGSALPLACPWHPRARFAASSAARVRQAAGHFCVCSNADAVGQRLQSLSLGLPL